MSAASHRYVVYVDEAGDPGVKQKSPSALAASSEWFVLAAVVVSAVRERDTVGWVRDMREAVRAQSRTPLHYRKLSLANQARVCRMLANKDVRLFVVASHKTNMRGYQNKRMGSRLGRGEFYNWCLRLLLERITQWCAHRSRLEGRGPEKAKIVLSERGGHDYSHLKAYVETLKMQAEAGTTFIRTREIVSDVLDHSLVEVRPHDALAGLQLADIAASSFFQGLDSTSSAYTIDNALELRTRVAKAPKQRCAAEFGLLKLPFRHQAEIPAGDRPLLEAFGYCW